MKKKCPVCLCAVDAKDSVCNFCKTPLAKSVGTSDLSNAFKPPTVVFDKKITSNSVKIPTELYNTISNEIETSKNLPANTIKQEETEIKITFESIKELTQNKTIIDTSQKTAHEVFKSKTVEENEIPKVSKFDETKEIPSNTYKRPKETLPNSSNQAKVTPIIEKKQEVKFDDIETPLNKFDFEHHLKEENQEQKTGKLINFERIITQIKALERTNQINTPLTKDMLTSTKPRNFLQDTFDIKLDALGFVEEELNFKDLKKHMKVSLDRESGDKQFEREQSKKEELKRKHFEILKRIMRERKKKYSLKLISTFPYYIAPFEIENLEIEEIKKDKKPQPPILICEKERNLEIEKETNTLSSNEVEIMNEEIPSFLEVEETTNKEEELNNNSEEVEIEEQKSSFFIPENIINNISTKFEISELDDTNVNEEDDVFDKQTEIEENNITEIIEKSTPEESPFDNAIEENEELNETKKETEHLESLTPISFDINKKTDDSLIGSVFSYDSQKTLDIFIPVDKNIIFETKSLSDLIEEKENSVISIESSNKIEREETLKTESNEESNQIELTLKPLEKNENASITSMANELPVEKPTPVLPKIEEEENNDVRQVIKNRLKRLSKKPTEEKIETTSNKVIVETKEDKVIEESTSKESPKFFKEDVEVKETEKINSNEIGLVRYKANEKMEERVLASIKKEADTSKIITTDSNIRTTLNTTNAKLMEQVQQGARSTNNPEALEYYNLARDLCVKNNYLYALTQLELSVKADPAFEQAHILLSRTYLKLKSSGHIELKP